ncbi:MAG: hypothetical protein NWE89_08720, partial [Candidatus Bathyarchaeota archaeon]|nr:hypothetical protein [Candidatus Bathyarchaeota archaeon]
EPAHRRPLLEGVSKALQAGSPSLVEGRQGPGDRAQGAQLMETEKHHSNALVCATQIMRNSEKIRFEYKLHGTWDIVRIKANKTLIDMLLDHAAKATGAA